MFGDGSFFEREGELDLFDAWETCVFNCMELCEAPIGDEQKNLTRHVLGHGEDGQTSFCLALLEFGCGLNVPTIRYKFRSQSDMYPENAVLVRINPDFPLVLEKEPRQCIEVMSRGLDCILEVENILQAPPHLFVPAAAGPSPKPKPKPKGKNTVRGKSPGVTANATRAGSRGRR